MRWLMSILAVIGLAGGVPLLTPAQAYACSCAYAPDGSQIMEQASQAAAVFTGTATSRRVQDQTAFYEFEVREVFSGEVGRSTTVSSSVQGPACGRGFEVGTEYLVFTSTYETHGAQWSDNSCSATTESSNSRTREATLAVYGQPRTVTPEDTSVAANSANETPSTPADTGSPRVWMAVATVIVIALMVTAFSQRNRFRRR